MSAQCRKRSMGARLVAPALLAALAACDDGSAAHGPAAMSEGEAAALADAEAMLGQRPDTGPAEETPPPAEDGNE